jgi:hypothetical protein
LNAIDPRNVPFLEGEASLFSARLKAERARDTNRAILATTRQSSTIWDHVLTWMVTRHCEQRLKFVREKLDYRSTRDAGVEYLRRSARTIFLTQFDMFPECTAHATDSEFRLNDLGCIPWSWGSAGHRTNALR